MATRKDYHQIITLLNLSIIQIMRKLDDSAIETLLELIDTVENLDIETK